MSAYRTPWTGRVSAPSKPVARHGKSEPKRPKVQLHRVPGLIRAEAGADVERFCRFMAKSREAHLSKGDSSSVAARTAEGNGLILQDSGVWHYKSLHTRGDL